MSGEQIPKARIRRRRLFRLVWVVPVIALVKLQGWAEILPGTGLFAFTAMVVLTMLASAAFDPKLIWQRP